MNEGTSGILSFACVGGLVYMALSDTPGEYMAWLLAVGTGAIAVLAVVAPLAFALGMFFKMFRSL
jgi:hypothetical protein